ncbi:hypothetical protein Y032_0683g1502 [Ancylostoma ceylanicum]|uniref:Uncharacterized protein n=1 Tax=Ancylostoma ceylanicum TaxID=53326 RepID=A0A016WH79_9BILA|nr:hypothetical protein Y032_0683g1502 [Ancylostoma ceylanicum]
MSDHAPCACDQTIPFTSAEWVTENSIIAAGRDCSPVLYTIADGNLKEVCKLVIPSEQRTSSVNTALQMFRNIDRQTIGDRATPPAVQHRREAVAWRRLIDWFLLSGRVFGFFVPFS